MNIAVLIARLVPTLLILVTIRHSEHTKLFYELIGVPEASDPDRLLAIMSLSLPLLGIFYGLTYELARLVARRG